MGIISNNAINNFLAGLGINSALGMPVIGIGGLFYSENIGGYQDPYYIDGYRYNPADGIWYLISPAPDLGQFAWENPASNQAELNEISALNMWHNKIEGLGPGDGNKNKTIPSQIVNDLYTAATQARPRDPLVFELNGSSLETTGVSTTNPVYFDFTGNGVQSDTQQRVRSFFVH